MVVEILDQNGGVHWTVAQLSWQDIMSPEDIHILQAGAINLNQVNNTSPAIVSPTGLLSM